MNFKRGLFRLWIVATVLWTILTLAATSHMPREEATVFLLLPPLVVGILLSALIWIAGGFRRSD